jgi:hypothetical protein
MSQMRSTPSALRLNALHPVTVVRYVFHVLFGYGRPKARPTRARFELGFRIEERGSATDAPIESIGFIRIIFAGESAFRAFFARHFKLYGRELLLPLRRRLFDALYLGYANQFSGTVELGNPHGLAPCLALSQLLGQEYSRHPGQDCAATAPEAILFHC